MRENWWRKFSKFQTQAGKVRGLGLMSGTSLDGLDLAYVEFETRKRGLWPKTRLELAGYKLLAFKTFSYPREWQDRSLAAMAEGVAGISLFHKEFGEKTALLVEDFLDQAKIPKQEVDFLAMHGQTVFHAHKQHSLQLGEADLVAKKLGLPVLFDFRQADLAVGGSGAPLVPFLDQFLAQKIDASVSFLNLGGIANFSYIAKPSLFGQRRVVATDTGPANMMSNILVKQLTDGKEFFDLGGNYAKKGVVRKDLLSWFFEQSFFAAPYPKSTGYQDFGDDFCNQALAKFPYPLEDFLHSSLVFSAQSLALGYQALVKDLKLIFVSGGGIYNPLLMAYIESELTKLYPELRFENFEARFKISEDAKEAFCFALLGLMRLLNQPSNLVTVTEAKMPVSLGKLALPD